MRARYARRIRAGVERARFEVELALDLGATVRSLLEPRVVWTDPDALAQRAYVEALRRRLAADTRPRAHRRTWRPLAA